MAGTERARITADTDVTVAELAVVLGLTSRRIRQLADEGIIQAVDKNAYNLAESVQLYNKFLSKNLPDAEDTKTERARRKAEVQLKASKAAIAMMEAQELQGKMHRSEDVAAMTADLIFEIRSALAALPGRLAVNVTAATSPAEASSIIQREVNKVMAELARYEYDPARYRERVMNRMDWNGLREGADDDG